MRSRVKFAISFIIILALAIAFCDPVTSTTVAYTFKCKSNDANSTMTHESRMTESRLEDNGNTLGYQAGSFNYLQKGRIKFEDLIEYHDGQNESRKDSLVVYNMTVFFEGEKGISEFFARGFFPGSRAIYSKKAIRFEEFGGNFTHDINNKFYNLRDNYSSEQIHVNAEILMGLNRERERGYDLAYNATVANGVIETWDTMGWTNKTGARRIDWEQSALMKGNITVENNLAVSKIFDTTLIPNLYNQVSLGRMP